VLYAKVACNGADSLVPGCDVLASSQGSRMKRVWLVICDMHWDGEAVESAWETESLADTEAARLTELHRKRFNWDFRVDEFDVNAEPR
jgi:hypothetical protein